MFVKQRSFRAALVGSCALAVLAGAQAAQAAQAAQTTPPQDSQLSEVVVTAQKRVEDVQKVPEQVSVVSSQFIDQLHATNLQDIGAYVPGLQVTPGGTPGQTTLGLRGINPIGSNVTVATYVDDVPVGGSSLYSNAAAFSLDLLPYDVSRIEVLSGPQGTLYGASTLGGLLKYDLTQADLHAFHAQTGADLLGVHGGGDVGGGVRASATGPIVADKLAFIASYALEDTPGYIDNVQLGRSDQNEVRQQGARLGLLWAPDPKLRVELNALYQQVSADGRAEVALDPASFKPVAGELKDNNYTAEPFRKEITILSARATYDAGFADLTSVTSYEYTNTAQTTDATRAYGSLVSAVGGPNPTIAPFDQHIQLLKYTQEARLASKPNEHFEWLIGGFVTYEHSTLGQVVPLLTAAGAPIPPFSAAALGGLPVSSPLAVINLASIYREYAGFGDFTWHVTPKLDVLGGVRYSYNSQSFAQLTTGSLEAPARLRGRSNEDVVTFTASPSYKITPDINAYLRFASGYQPGGPNIALPDQGVPLTVGSDTLTQYEAGLKTRFLNRRGTFNIAAFYNDWRDIQITALSSGGIGYIANAGRAKSEGVDATGSLLVLPGLTVGGTFDYTYAVFTRVDPGAAATLGARDGRLLPQTPRFSGSLLANYTHPLTGDWSYGLGAALRLRGARYSAANYTTLYFREPDYGALDLNASLQNGRYTVRLFAKNITDVRTYDTYAATPSLLTGTPAQATGVLIQPRTIGLAVDARF